MTSLCKKRGWKINRFVEDALTEKLEELADLEDLALIRKKNLTAII